MRTPLQVVGTWLARYLTGTSRAPYPNPPTDLNLLARLLLPCDVLLVEGNRRISTAIKYLTQSTWSHAALFVGRDLGRNRNDEPLVFIDADAVAGVRGVPISEFGGLHARICRPFAITPADAMRVIDYAIARLGEGYDLKNVVDLGAGPVALEAKNAGLGKWGSYPGDLLDADRTGLPIRAISDLAGHHATDGR